MRKLVTPNCIFLVDILSLLIDGTISLNISPKVFPSYFLQKHIQNNVNALKVILYLHIEI